MCGPLILSNYDYFQPAESAVLPPGGGNVLLVVWRTRIVLRNVCPKGTCLVIYAPLKRVGKT